jgi:hypothetical protein
MTLHCSAQNSGLFSVCQLLTDLTFEIHRSSLRKEMSAQNDHKDVLFFYLVFKNMEDTPKVR